MPQTEYQRKWYQDNKERCKEKTYRWRREHPEYQQDYYQRNRDKFRQRYIDNKEEILNRTVARYYELKTKTPEVILYRAAKARAKKKGLEFNIELSDIVIPSVCPILGIDLFSSNTGKNEDNSPSLDRLDPKKGYIKGNVNVISWKSNRFKNDATATELRLVADWIDKNVH